MQHAKWAVTDANVRSRATVQMFEYLSGNLPRLPKTTIEVYGKIVDQKLPVSSDLNEKLFEKVGETQDTVQALRSGFSVFSVRSSVAKKHWYSWRMSRVS